MNVLLVKLFATALTFSQVATRPEAVRTSFDPGRDGPEVSRLLQDGCAHLRKAFDIEDINVDELIATALQDPQAVAGDTKILKGLDLKDLDTAYRQFCKGEAVKEPAVDLGDVMRAYNEAVADLPDVATLKGQRLPGATTVLDGAGQRFSEIHGPDGRRIWVPLASVPEIVRKAFVAAEDKRFFAHRGVDERGVIRAFMNNLGGSGRPQGGSTITQQVVKNLLTGDDVTYQRKMREMVLAARLERLLTKDEILEIYLNAIFLGRSSWGIEMAARSYFGKSVGALNLREAALLAGLPKGPNYYDPDRFPERSRERLAYVLSRLKDEGAIDEAARAAALAEKPVLVAAARSRRDTGLYFLDHLNREARTFAGLDGLTAQSVTVRSTLDAGLQRAAETALQDGLARYELGIGRQRFVEPEGNLAAAIEKLKSLAAGPADPARPASAGEKPGAAAEKPGAAAAAAVAKPDWLRALEGFRPPLYDVHWPVGVVVATGAGGFKVGLRDGRVLPLAVPGGEARRALKLHDVVLVRAPEGKAKGGRAELRMRPSVQGAAVVIENRTGRILAMTGGFSYPLSQLNRATQSLRQPGSTLKPLSYLAALAAGIQPNTLIADEPVTLAAIGGIGQSWTPRNADRSDGGLMTLRRGLEQSRNQVTARLLDGVIAAKPEASLQRVCDLALETELYAECERYYPFVLGAQPARLLDLAVVYATIANEGGRPSAYGLEAVEDGARALYRHEAKPLYQVRSADRAAFYQLKSMLQGVVARGTASSMAALAPYLAGKTGTSENENDAWFAGFTNDVTTVVWVGYDNADGQRRTLGRGRTGGKVAVPIFEAIMKAAWAGRPRAPLAPPSPDAKRMLADVAIDYRSGDPTPGVRGFTEHLRRSSGGEVADTQHRFAGQRQDFASRTENDDDIEVDSDALLDLGGRRSGQGKGRTEADGRASQFPWRLRDADLGWGLGSQLWPDEPLPQRRRTRRVDPDYLWNRGDLD